MTALCFAAIWRVLRNWEILLLFVPAVFASARRGLRDRSSRSLGRQQELDSQAKRRHDGEAVRPYWATNEPPPPTNPRPLIGILSQPGDGDGGSAPKLVTRFGCISEGSSKCLRKKSHGSDERNATDVSYIAASYVKWVEGAGGRPVPIRYDDPKHVIEKQLRAVNGLIIPGGSTPLEPGPFFDAVEFLLTSALETNDRGDYFPVQFTCMGFEALVIFLCQNFSKLEAGVFSSLDNATPLTFFSEWAKQRSMFAWMTPSLLSSIQGANITMENHEDGISLDNFLATENLTSFLHILTTSKDKKGKEYVSTAEAKHYPFYATQWHPEKNAYEWGLQHIPHLADAVAVTQAAANFFVNEARRSSHHPDGAGELNDLLVYNTAPTFSGRNGDGFFEQTYIFRRAAEDS